MIVGKVVMALEDIPAAVATVMKGAWSRLTHVPLTEVALSHRVGRH